MKSRFPDDHSLFHDWLAQVVEVFDTSRPRLWVARLDQTVYTGLSIDIRVFHSNVSASTSKLSKACLGCMMYT